MGILQARTLEWVAISFSNAWKWKVKVKLPSRVQLFVTPWTAAYQAPPGDLPNPEIEPMSPTLQVDSLPSEPPEKPKNTGMGSLSLLQGISLTQESNQGLLHYRQILYQLSYQGKNCSFENKGFISKVMSLVFNRLSRLAIAFLPRSKQLLISWLQSPCIH